MNGCMWVTCLSIEGPLLPTPHKLSRRGLSSCRCKLAAVANLLLLQTCCCCNILVSHLMNIFIVCLVVSVCLATQTNKQSGDGQFASCCLLFIAISFLLQWVANEQTQLLTIVIELHHGNTNKQIFILLHIPRVTRSLATRKLSKDINGPILWGRNRCWCNKAEHNVR